MKVNTKDRRLGSGDFKVTTKQVSEWVGNGFNDSREEAFIEIITDVANGKYDIEELNSDIRSYA
tara:strand:- start:44 stop:235 length:192 start_codon:yes stop_codon:yes gene_type:complete